jgi:helix-turn-helix protein
MSSAASDTAVVRKVPPSFRFRWQLAIRDDEVLSRTAKLVDLTLALHMNPEGGDCFAGIDRLTRECHSSANTVRKGRDELVDRGFLEVEPGGGAGRTNRHRALLPHRSPLERFNPFRPKHSTSAPVTAQPVHPRETDESEKEGDNKLYCFDDADASSRRSPSVPDPIGAPSRVHGAATTATAFRDDARRRAGHLGSGPPVGRTQDRAELVIHTK